MTRPVRQPATPSQARKVDTVVFVALLAKVGASAATAMEEPPVCRPLRRAAA